MEGSYRMDKFSVGFVWAPAILLLGSQLVIGFWSVVLSRLIKLLEPTRYNCQAKNIPRLVKKYNELGRAVLS